MSKKHWTVGYNFYYSELQGSSMVVYGTEDEAKAYVLSDLDKQSDWLKDQVDRNFKSTSRTKVYIHPLKVIIL